MKNLIIGIAAVALVVGLSVPVMAWVEGDPTGDGFSVTANVTLVVEHWASILLDEDTLTITLPGNVREGFALTGGNLGNNCDVCLSADVTTPPAQGGTWTASTIEGVIGPGSHVYDGEPLPFLKVEVSGISNTDEAYKAGTYEGGVVTLTVSEALTQ